MKRVRMLGGLCLLFGLIVPFSQAAGGEKPAPQADLGGLLWGLKGNQVETRLDAMMRLADHGPQAAAAVPDLIEALQKGDDHLRLSAAITLGRIGKAAVQPLTRLLTSKDVDTRYYSVWALAWVGPAASTAAPAVSTLLADDDVEVRRRAAHALSHIAPDPKIVLPALWRRLNEPDAVVWKAVSGALVRFRARAVPGLCAALDEKQTCLRAAEVLGAIGADAAEAVPVLRKLLLAQEGAPEVAAKALGQIGQPGLAALSEAIGDQRRTVRQAGCRGLMLAGAETLIAAFDSPYLDVRREALSLLTAARVKSRGAVLALARALKDTDDEVRRGAAFALCFPADTAPALPALLDTLRDRDARARGWALEALRKAPPDAERELPVLAKLLRDRDPVLRASAVQVLRRHGTAAVPHYLTALQDADAGVRGEVLWNLRYLEGDLRKLLPGVVPFLKSKASNERREAVSQLGRMGESALPHLAQALADEDAEVRRLAVEGLGVLGTTVKGAVSHLLRGLKDSSVTVRWTAAQALGNLGAAAREALPALEAARSDPSFTVRGAVEDALRRIQSK